MRHLLIAIFCIAAMNLIASENVIHDDGTGAQISYSIPTKGEQDGTKVEYSGFRLTVTKEKKFLLFTDLPGHVSEDGKFFQGSIIIPSEFVKTAEIIVLGSPPDSTMGLSKKLNVREFKRIEREKSWTDQK
jgi:hypothetical protein